MQQAQGRRNDEEVNAEENVFGGHGHGHGYHQTGPSSWWDGPYGRADNDAENLFGHPIYSHHYPEGHPYAPPHFVQ